MFLKRLHKAEEAIISLLLVSMTLLVFIEVVLRFGFGTGFSWGQELTLHLSAGLFCLVSPMASRLGLILMWMPLCDCFHPVCKGFCH